MLSPFLRAIAQLYDPHLRRVLWTSLGGGLALVVTLGLGIIGLLAVTRFVASDWLETLIDMAGALTTLVLFVTLFPALVSIISGLLLEEVARAVEARHYPDLPPARTQSVGETVMTVTSFSTIIVAVNLLAFPLYLLPIINILVFLTINSYLLGREYFELVALRRMKPEEVRRLRIKYRARVMYAGFVISVFASIPLLNLMLPPFGAAFMIHIFERLRQESKFV